MESENKDEVQSTNDNKTTIIYDTNVDMTRVDSVSIPIPIQNESQSTNDNNKIIKRLEPTIFNIVFLREYKNMNQTPKEKYLWRLLIIMTVISQLFCLLVLTNTFIHKWQRDYKQYGAEYPDDKLYEDRGVFIISYAPLWFFALIASLIVTGSYLTKSLRPFIVLLAICLTDSKLYKSPLNYKWGIFLAFINFAMIVSTWALALFIAFYGVYFKIDEPSDVILAAIGIVFILEIDNYICEWTFLL